MNEKLNKNKFGNSENIRIFVKEIKNKMSKKIIIGKEYWVIQTPDGKPSSNGQGTRSGDVKVKVKVIDKENVRGSVVNSTSGGRGSCWYYDYELKSITISVENIDSEITELKKTILDSENEIKELEIKKQFMSYMKVDSFDEESFKAYQVLKVLGIDDFEKAKQITKILSN